MARLNACVVQCIGSIPHNVMQHTIDKGVEQKVWTLLFVQMKQDFTVRVSGEGIIQIWVRPLEVGLQLRVVVDLAIDRYGGVIIIVDDWLCSGIKSDNGQPLMCQDAVLEASDAIPIRTSMLKEFGQSIFSLKLVKVEWSGVEWSDNYYILCSG
jgi:hypothetical protein